MTVRESLLALLAEESAHGYGLKARFESRTAHAWPLNVGQVYTTLARLRRDGLIESKGTDEADRQTWRLTDAGADALEAWYATPIIADPPARDALAIKVLIAAATDAVDVAPIVQRQREASIARLQELTRLKQQADPERELPWLLLLDALILKSRAEVDWLDLVEGRLAEARP